MNTPLSQSIEYRGFVLKLIQDPQTQLWVVHYTMKGQPPVIAQFQWKTIEAAEAHGKRMIDAIKDNLDALIREVRAGRNEATMGYPRQSRK
jgi:hypothetical protein